MNNFGDLPIRPNHANRRANRRAVQRLTQRLENTQEVVDECWQAYIDIGQNFFRNVPLTIFSTQYDDTFSIPGNHQRARFDSRSARNDYDFGYNIDYAFTNLVWFNNFREFFNYVEGQLRGRPNFAHLQRVMTDWEHQAGELRQYMHRLETAYEGLVAGCNALAASGRLPARDVHADSRMESFRQWATLIDEYSRTAPEDMRRWARNLGWSYDSSDDSESEDDS